MLFLLFVISMILLYFSSKWYKSIFNPINIFFGINLLSLILMYGLSGLNSSLSPMIWYIILIMFASYLTGVFLGSFNYRLSKEKQTRKKETSKKRLLYTIICYSILYNISAIVYIWEINKNFGFVGILSKLTKMNLAFQSGEFNIGVFGIFLPISYALSLLVLYYIKFFNKSFLLIIQYILCYIPALSPRRDTLFYLIFMSTTFLFLTQKEKQSTENIKKYFKIFSVTLLTIWFMGMSQNLLNKASTHTFKLFHVPIPSFLNEIIIYIAGNYPYLQKLYELGQLSTDHFLLASLRIYYIYIAPFFGVHINTKAIFALPLMNIGTDFKFLFNTAPMLYYFIKESGVCFFIGFIILGFVTQKFYKRFIGNISAGNLLLVTYMYFLDFFSFRSYNLIYLSTVLILVYMLFAYFVVDVERD